jgi:hypothetical protein
MRWIAILMLLTACEANYQPNCTHDCNAGAGATLQDLLDMETNDDERY